VKKFLDDIISYISQKFEKEILFGVSTKVSVNEAYEENVQLKPPHIFVQIIDDSQAQEYDTLDGECISFVPIQISVYGQQMKVWGLPPTTYSAKESTNALADAVKKLFTPQAATSWNSNIKLIRRVGGTPCMPTQNGTTTYFSPIRYNIYIDSEYKSLK
jgi:hypothetical protein